MVYQLAKMDGAIALNGTATKIAWCNVQLMPDPTILSSETGTRHRTAERVSKQTDALVIAVSQRRDVVSLYVDGAKYILEEIPAVLAKANQALATLDKYRSRLDQVGTRLTALEFEGGVTLHDVLTVLPARRAGDAHGRGDRALHRRARLGGVPLIEMQLGRPWSAWPVTRQRSCTTTWPSRATTRSPSPSTASLGWPIKTCAGLRAAGGAAQAQGQHARLSRLAPRLSHPRPHPPAPEAGGAEHRPRVPRARRDIGGDRPELESVDGVVRSGRRTSARAFAAYESGLVDRYLQT